MEMAQQDDIEKSVIITVEANFKETGKAIFPQELATLSEDNKPTMKILQNLDNGSYVFNYQGKNYELDLITMANNFVKEMRKRGT